MTARAAHGRHRAAPRAVGRAGAPGGGDPAVDAPVEDLHAARGIGQRRLDVRHGIVCGLHVAVFRPGINELFQGAQVGELPRFLRRARQAELAEEITRGNPVRIRIGRERLQQGIA
mgnify:CR=1 FL=1